MRKYNTPEHDGFHWKNKQPGENTAGLFYWSALGFGDFHQYDAALIIDFCFKAVISFDLSFIFYTVRDGQLSLFIDGNEVFFDSFFK